MLPVTDFNFVVCGFATLAATVGYACARKARPLPSRAVPQPLPGDEPISDPAPESSSKMVVEKPIFVDEPESYTTPSEPTCEPEPGPETTPTTVVRANSSLKRKRTQDQDDAEAHEADPNLSSIYPNKRRSGSVPAEDPTNSAAHDSSSSEEPQPATKLELSDPVPSDRTRMLLRAVRVQKHLNLCPLSQDLRFRRPSTHHTIPYRPNHGFARIRQFWWLFVPIFSTNSQKDSISIASKPIWASTTAAAETTVAGLDGEADETAVSQSALVAVKPQNVTIPHSTGEEDEDIILELKGAKLYIKRGEENFSGGMVGQSSSSP
ncbi:hypothetical protein DFH06DRAFT_1434199, partial [Mycena polygramma]